MRALVLILPLAMLAFPPAEAGGGGWYGWCGHPMVACIWDSHASQGDCETGGWEARWTFVGAETPTGSRYVALRGYERCWTDAEGSHTSHGITVYHTDWYTQTETGWTWHETNGVSRCRMGPLDDCPLGPPPALPWGHFLP